MIRMITLCMMVCLKLIFASARRILPLFAHHPIKNDIFLGILSVTILENISNNISRKMSDSEILKIPVTGASDPIPPRLCAFMSNIRLSETVFFPYIYPLL